MKGERLVNTKDINEYNLNNLENYREHLVTPIQDILDKLVRIIVDYIIFVSEKLHIKNTSYYHFIFQRGLHSLLHVFNIILYHTNNVDLTIYHCQKAYYFYIEFIEQIADDSVTFLKLTSKDAVMFVYKRTIFELNNDFRKKKKNINNEENKLYLQINTYICFYKKIFNYLITTSNIEYDNNKDLLKTKCFKIEEMTLCISKFKLKQLQIECIDSFYHILTENNILFEETFELLIKFIRELSYKKSNLSQKTIQNKVLNSTTTNYINEYGYQNLISYIFSEDS
jgi:hypothetical protein